MRQNASASRPLLSALLLIIAIGAAYTPALRGGFLWDDDTHISANPTIVGPLGLKEIWTTAQANYFPLVLTNFRGQHTLWGLNPTGYHMVTLLFHVGAALMLWRVLLALRVPGAWLGAALWALHPVQVESVAWICELKNTQSAVFFLLAIWFWTRVIGEASSASLRAAGAKRNRFYFAALACALAAVLSKPSTVMLPVALALCTWWLRRRFTLRDLLSLAPFFALSAIAAGWTIWEQKYHSGAIGDEWNQTWAERGLVAGRVIWFYLGKLAWPQNLTFIYPRWVPGASPVLGLLLLVSAAGFGSWTWWQRERFRGAFLAWAYFVVLLFPVLGFFDVYFFRYSFVGDHFQYLASMGPLALAGAGFSIVGLHWSRVVAAAGLLALTMLTAAQSADYRSSDTLWRATVARNPGSAMAWAQLGAVQVQAGRQADAIVCFQRALSLNPKHPEALNHLGCEYLRLGRANEAIVELEKAVQARPDFAEAYSNLGLALLQSGRGSEAMPHLEHALQLRPDAAAPHYNIARALLILERPTDAVAQYEEALRIEPGRAETHDDFGQALEAVGRTDEAVAEYRRALQLQPGLASAHNSLGVAFAKQGKMPEALAEFDEAVRATPDYVDAYINRGGALAAMNRTTEASAAFSRAVELDPNSAKAHGYLGRVLQALGREFEAQNHLRRAAELEQASSVHR